MINPLRFESFRNPHRTPALNYDRLNREHQDWLLWWLDGLGIPFSQLDRWGDAMHGQPQGRLDVLIKKFKKKRGWMPTIK